MNFREIDTTKYVVLNDGQFMWPANASDVAAYDGDDVMDDAGVATAGRIPEELMPYIGYGVGSQECIDLCNYLLGKTE